MSCAKTGCENGRWLSARLPALIALIAFVFLTVWIILLFGCQQATVQPPVTTGFSCTVSATYNGTTITGTLRRPAAGQLILAVTAPATLNGLSLRWDGNSLSVAWQGLQTELTADAVPQAALIRALAQVLDSAATASPAGDDSNRLEGTVAGRAYTITLQPKTGFPLRVSIPSLSLTADFSAVTALATE